MNKILIIFFTVLFCLTSSVGWSGDFQKGSTAYRKGDFTTAIKEWTTLALKGNGDAQFALGVMYENGKGVLKDYKTALKWYRLGAEQGNAYAQFSMGYMYENGKGVLKDYKIAFKWYRLGAEQGNAHSQLNLGTLYVDGRGILKDNIYAYMWFNISASNGNKKAVTNRDIIEKKMTPTDISAAQKLARECVKKIYKGC